jgi:hypothetical protein
MESVGYETVGEDSPDFDKWIAEVRWVDINDVNAKDIALPTLPRYIPIIPSGSRQLFTDYRPPMVAVKLGDVVSTEKLLVADCLETRFGIPLGTKVILLCYGKDRLIENLWPRRHEIFSKLASLGFAGVAAVNYSVWDSQPHSERLINIKKSLLTYEDLQNIGIPAIPHIYWYGRVNLNAWLRWLDNNPTVGVIAINMQTLRKQQDWERALNDLRYFVTNLKRPIHFLITGPQTPLRVAEIKSVLPFLNMTNGYPVRKALASHRISIDAQRVVQEYTPSNKSMLFQENVQQYEVMLGTGQNNISEGFLARYRANLSVERKRRLAEILKTSSTLTR